MIGDSYPDDPWTPCGDGDGDCDPEHCQCADTCSELDDEDRARCSGAVSNAVIYGEEM